MGGVHFQFVRGDVPTTQSKRSELNNMHVATNRRLWSGQIDKVVDDPNFSIASY